jgi:hypothetical protein
MMAAFASAPIIEFQIGSISVMIETVERRSSQKKKEKKYLLIPMDDAISSKLNKVRVIMFMIIKA